MNDYIGRPIRKGHIVALAQRSGNTGFMGIAIVLDTFKRDKIDMVRIVSAKKSWQGWRIGGRNGETYPDRLCVIDDAPIEILEVLNTAYQIYWRKV